MVAACAIIMATGAWTRPAGAQAAANDADKVCVYGDVDNFGFKFPPNFDVFAGRSTAPHSYPWPNKVNADPSPDEAPGTDRVMVGSAVQGSDSVGHQNARDGYAGGTKRSDTGPRALQLRCDRGTLQVSSVAVQLFVDDFQAPLWGSKFTSTINGKPFGGLAAAINALDQIGPAGRLITVAVPPDLVNDVLNGGLVVDDATTGIGVGYAIDFERTLLNPHLGEHSGTIVGKLTDVGTGQPVAGATVSAAGMAQAVSGPDGVFSIPNVPAGVGVLTASAANHLPSTATVDVVAATSATL